MQVGVCGEHGGDPSSVEFFAAIGLDYVSCSPFRYYLQLNIISNWILVTLFDLLRNYAIATSMPWLNVAN